MLVSFRRFYSPFSGPSPVKLHIVVAFLGHEHLMLLLVARRNVAEDPRRCVQ